MGNTIPAGGDTCPPDLPLKDCKSALLYPSRAPLVDFAKGAGSWDFRATWAHVPTQTDSSGKVLNLHTILLYMHGHTNAVKVDQDGNCVKPDWASAELFAQIKPCTPSRYGLASLADAAPNRPIVLAPENASPADRVKNVAGRFSQSNGMAQFIGDCTLRLARLTKHTSCGDPPGTYLPANVVSAIKRIIMVGHSGGGITLQGCATSGKILDFFPSDLVMLDCLYGHDGGGAAYVNARKAPGTMGNGPDNARLIITTTGGSTQTSGNALVAQVKKDLGLTHTTIEYDQSTKRPKSIPDFSKVGGNILEIGHVADNTFTPSDANLAFILLAMQKCPVVYIRTNVDHDHNPNVFIKLVLQSAPA